MHEDEREWAGEPQLRAMAVLFDVDIAVLTRDGRGRVGDRANLYTRAAPPSSARAFIDRSAGGQSWHRVCSTSGGPAVRCKGTGGSLCCALAGRASVVILIPWHRLRALGGVPRLGLLCVTDCVCCVFVVC